MQLLCPHPVKNVADGRPVRVCPVILYSETQAAIDQKSGTALMSGACNLLPCQDTRTPSYRTFTTYAVLML